jgi:hypothetical protein
LSCRTKSSSRELTSGGAAMPVNSRIIRASP